MRGGSCGGNAVRHDLHSSDAVFATERLGVCSLDQWSRCMADDDQVEKLKAEHASLEEAIEEELGRPVPNSTLLSDLKRQKLRIKDEIHRIAGP